MHLKVTDDRNLRGPMIRPRNRDKNSIALEFTIFSPYIRIESKIFERLTVRTSFSLKNMAINSFP